MDKKQIQELCEQIAIGAMNGGNLYGMVFRHDDSSQKGVTDAVIVKADNAVPQLEGCRGFRVNVRIEIRSQSPQKNVWIFGEVMSRILNAAFVRNAAVEAGLTSSDDLYLLDEEISGDRSETKSLRKRNIAIPFLINAKT
jgi:hypothetical protein